MSNINQLIFDTSKFVFSEPATQITVSLRRISNTDSFVLVPGSSQTLNVNGDATIYTMPVVPSTEDSLYELSINSRKGQMLRAFFVMPADDVFLNDLELWTAYPSRGAVIRRKFIDLEDTPDSLTDNNQKYLRVENGRFVFADTIDASTIVLDEVELPEKVNQLIDTSSQQIYQQKVSEFDDAIEVAQNTGFVARIYDTPQAAIGIIPAGAYYNVRASTPNIYAEEYLNNNGTPQATGKIYPTLQAWNDALTAVATMGDSKLAAINATAEIKTAEVNTMGELKKAQLSEIAATVSGLNAGQEFFDTEALLIASNPSIATKVAKALDTKKVWLWQRTSAEGATPVTGTWIDTGLSELDLANARMDANISTALTQAKAYTHNQSLDLFKSTIDLSYANDMPVRRYTAALTFNDYAAGTYQTLVADKVNLAVIKSGSAVIKHYFTTSIAPQKASFEFKTNSVDSASDAIGVGFLSAGVYKAIVYSVSGTVRENVNFDSPGGAKATGLGVVSVGDTLRFDYANNEVSIYLNNVFKFKTTLVGTGVFVVAQGGFGTYSSTASGATIDPIRDYVQAEIASATVNAQSPSHYSYSADTKTFMAYSQVKANLYVGFEVQRETDMSDLIYKDYWRMLQAAFYTYENGTMQATGRTAVVGGENEFVFRQNSTKDDFTGGYHGDELVTDIKLMVDGFPISTLSNIPLTAANKVEYIEKSTMHETASGGVVVEGHPVIAYHTKHTSFKDGGYKTWNHVKWNYAGTMSTLYHGISCISKDVASVGFSDDTFTDASFTGSNNNFFTAIGTRLFKGRNPASGLAVEATSRQIKVNGADELSELFIKDRTEDSKYYRKSPPRIVEVGEIHESYFECRFTAI